MKFKILYKITFRYTTSDRPDGAFKNYIFVDNVNDLKHAEELVNYYLDNTEAPIKRYLKNIVDMEKFHDHYVTEN